MRSLYLTFALCIGAGAADATVIFTVGNHPQPGDITILLNSGATGMLVTGTPSGQPSFVVDFSSTQSLSEPAAGIARVSGNPEGTPLNDLTISLENGATYGDLIINPFIGGCSACQGGQATVSVLDNLGITHTFMYTLGIGNNYLTITTADGESIVSTNISGGSYIALQQPIISELAAATPEPGTYAPLMALALGGLALLRRSPKA
jgi:hypothetical protein